MELQTNGHGKATSKTTSKAKKKVGSMARQARSGAQHLASEGETRVSEVVEEAASFIKRHPKTAIALALGVGIGIGAVANGRFGRAAFVGIVGLIADRFA